MPLSLGPSVRFALICLSAFLLGAPVSAQRVLFVDADALGSADGMSWADAFADLQQALALAVSGDEVWVAEGTYYPASTGDRDASFVLPSGVQLYGGFEGNEGVRTERDPSAYETVLSGDLGTPGEISDNAYRVVVASGVDASTVLDGFTITGGHGDELSPRNQGAGIYAEDANLTIRTCRVLENRVTQTVGGDAGGAGGYFTGGAPVFEEVVFERNAGVLGGGLWLRDEVEATLTEVTFRENTAISGAGVYSVNSTLRVVGAAFVRNVASRGGAGVNVSGGAGTFLNVGFYGNVARTDDGDGLSSGAGLSVFGSTLSLTNTTFVGNTARQGAAIDQGAGSLVVTNSTFAANEAEDFGGTRLSSGADLTAHNAMFWGNAGGEIDQVSGSTTLRHVLIAGGCPPDTPFGETVCENLLEAEPLFARSPHAGADATWGTPDDDYGDLALQQDSPALDAGQDELLPPDTFDLDEDGNTTEPLPLDFARAIRMAGTDVDLGAYERPPSVAIDPEATQPEFHVEAYPNPAHGPVVIAFTLGQAQRAEVALFDVQGRRVALLHDGPMTAGQHALRLETATLPSGVYIVRLRGDTTLLNHRLVILR